MLTIAALAIACRAVASLDLDDSTGPSRTVSLEETVCRRIGGAKIGAARCQTLTSSPSDR